MGAEVRVHAGSKRNSYRPLEKRPAPRNFTRRVKAKRILAFTLFFSIPQYQIAHVWGDTIENDGSNRDVTYLPRTSHESITYGSLGVFTTAEELAVWGKSLFGGKMVNPASLKHTLDFNP